MELTLSSNHVCDLNDGIDIGFREDTFTTSTLDIERQDTKRSDMRPISFCGVRDQRRVTTIERETR